MLNQEKQKISDNYLALDVGTKRIGVARASAVAKLAEPMAAIPVDGNEQVVLRKLIADEQAGTLIVGLPRSLEGNDTEQTAYTREFIQKLSDVPCTIITMDEAGTSLAAEEYLQQKHRQRWPDENIDSVSAMIILQDYLSGVLT